MKFFLVSILLAIANAEKLDNAYLPPASAAFSGGNEKLLKVPLHTFENLQGVSPSGSIKQSSEHVHNSGPSYGSSITPQRYGINKEPIKIVRFENNNDGLGNYAYGYETENKINVQESGQIKNSGTKNQANVVHGSYSYPGTDGIIYTVNYVADENGFQVSGAHLPTPPPIPEAIIKAIEYNAAHPESVNYGLQEESHQEESHLEDSFKTKELPIKVKQFGAPSNQYIIPAVKSGFDPKTGYNY